MRCTILNDERNLIEMAKYKLPDIFSRDMSPIELLELLQHQGISTRLLDITENPEFGEPGTYRCMFYDDEDYLIGSDWVTITE